jgi:uncharacterized protein (UPF0303 family)
MFGLPSFEGPGRIDMDRPAEVIAALEEQERRLVLARFDNDDAWSLGRRLVDLAHERGLGITIDIRRHGHQLFHAALPGTTPDNDVWIDRKVRVVNRFGESSFLVGRRLAAAGKVLDAAAGVDPLTHAAAGGCFPLRIRDVGPVGTVTVSGLAQADDHALVVEALTAHLAALASTASTAP